MDLTLSLSADSNNTWVNQMERNTVSYIRKTISEILDEDNGNGELHIWRK